MKHYYTHFTVRKKLDFAGPLVEVPGVHGKTLVKY